MFVDRKRGSAGMPRPISYAVFCLKKLTDFNQQLNVLLFWVCQPVLQLRACMPTW